MNIDHTDICNLSKIPVKMGENPFRMLALHFAKGEDNLDYAKELFMDSSLKEKCSQTLGHLYGVSDSSVSVLPPNVIFSPWTHFRPVDHQKFNDVFFIVFSDENYLKFHYNRIKKLVFSIKERGYNPDKFPTRQGGICGHFLTDGNRKKFYVTAGNHRAAVFSALYPDKKIPIIIEDKFTFKPRDLENRGPILDTYSSDHVKNWPAVKNNFLKEDHALQILESYL
jgi:hypothetical protein